MSCICPIFGALGPILLVTFGEAIAPNISMVRVPPCSLSHWRSFLCSLDSGRERNGVLTLTTVVTVGSFPSLDFIFPACIPETLTKPGGKSIYISFGGDFGL